MASISAPPIASPSTYTDRNPRYISLKNPKFFVPSSDHCPSSRKLSSRASEYAICRCQNRSDLPSPSEDYVHRRWDSSLQEAAKSAIKRFADFVNSHRNSSKNHSSVHVADKEVEDWDWGRWMEHFKEIEEQEKIISILKSQISDAIQREDYKDAAKLKVAIAAATTNDTVGRVISYLNRAVEKENYQDAAFIRDYAGAGLVGWWAGISEDPDDPYGRIICISAEHGRYVARGYSPRQLATATPGAALFEIFLTTNEKGEYKQQAVYLKRERGKSGGFPTQSSKLSDPGSGLNPLSDSTEGKSGLSAASTEDLENNEDREDDSDLTEGLAGFQNILQDMIPGIKLKVLKVTAPGKVDMDVISKVIEQIIEEDEEKDLEVEGVETDDEVKAGSDRDQDEIKMDAGGGISDLSEDRDEISVKVVIGGQLSDHVPSKDLIRVPARLEKMGRLSFLFSIDEDISQLEAGGRRRGLSDKNPNIPGQRNFDNVMSDLAKFIISREKIPMKVLKDVGELISLTLSQAQNRQPLSGSTIFNRIEIPSSSDPLNGLYIGAHGIFTSEVIHLRRTFGQWQEDGVNQKPPNLEFYEYVEALKLTGDPYVPAGQVAFRAKVGKQYQLPHKGIIPEELGVIARYKGQGRLAEPGFLNPRWVDGELVILDGKYIKGGPVVGFVYWAPEYRFLVFFNRLRLWE